MKCSITYQDFVSHPSGLRGHRQSKPRRGTRGCSESKQHLMDVPTVSLLVNSCASYHKYFHIHLYLIHLFYSDLLLIFSQISYIQLILSMTFKVIWWLNKIFYLDCDNGNKKKGYDESLNIREVSHILSDYLQLHANHQNLSEFEHVFDLSVTCLRLLSKYSYIETFKRRNFSNMR